MSAPTKDTKDKQDRPEGDMSVGSTSIALGGTQDADRARAPEAVEAPRDGTGSVGDGKRPAKRRETDSGTSSTSVGTGTGMGTGTGGSSEP